MFNFFKSDIHTLELYQLLERKKSLENEQASLVKEIDNKRIEINNNQPDINDLYNKLGSAIALSSISFVRMKK